MFNQTSKSPQRKQYFPFSNYPLLSQSLTGRPTSNHQDIMEQENKGIISPKAKQFKIRPSKRPASNIQ